MGCRWIVMDAEIARLMACFATKAEAEAWRMELLAANADDPFYADDLIVVDWEREMAD